MDKEFLDYQKYLIETISKCFGVPACYFVPLNETLWQKIKRNVRLSIYKIGLKIKRKEKKKNVRNNYYGKSLIEEILLIEQQKKMIQKIQRDLYGNRFVE